MFLVLINLILLPSALSYTIKVQGKIEMGDQMAELFKELRESIFQQSNDQSVEADRTRHNHKMALKKVLETDDGYGMPKQKDFPFLNGVPLLENKEENQAQLEEFGDISLVQEMALKKDHMAHIYGSHVREGGSDQPFNNIQA